MQLGLLLLSSSVVAPTAAAFQTFSPALPSFRTANLFITGVSTPIYGHKASSRPIGGLHRIQQSPFSSSGSSVRMGAAGGGPETPPSGGVSSLARTGVTLLAWLGFVGYAFLLAPGKSEAAQALDMELLKTLIANPLSTTVTPLFVAVFNALGVMPMVYSLLLLPGSRDQKLPTGLFCAASFFLGFFAMGPYLALRSYAPTPALPKARWLMTVLESRIPAMLALVGAVYVVYLGLLGGGGPADLASRWAEYVELFKSQIFVHVSSVDLLVLSLFVVDPLREDMERRGWGGKHSKLVAFASVPVLGPCLYLVLRPSIQVDEDANKEA